MFPWEKNCCWQMLVQEGTCSEKNPQHIKLDLCEASVNLCILWKSATFLSGDQQHTECWLQPKTKTLISENSQFNTPPTTPKSNFLNLQFCLIFFHSFVNLYKYDNWNIVKTGEIKIYTYIVFQLLHKSPCACTHYSRATVHAAPSYTNCKIHCCCSVFNYKQEGIRLKTSEGESIAAAHISIMSVSVIIRCRKLCS